MVVVTDFNTSQIHEWRVGYDQSQGEERDQGVWARPLGNTLGWQTQTNTNCGLTQPSGAHVGIFLRQA